MYQAYGQVEVVCIIDAQTGDFRNRHLGHANASLGSEHSVVADSEV